MLKTELNKKKLEHRKLKLSNKLQELEKKVGERNIEYAIELNKLGYIEMNLQNL